MTVCYNNYFVVISDITSILRETPTQYELRHLFYDIRDKWYDIGLSLQVRRYILDDFNQSQKNDVVKLFDVIDNFLTTQPSPVTWETVKTAMESPIVNNKEIAKLIHQYLSTGKIKKLLLLINEVINSGVQTTPVNCIQFNLNQHKR